MLSTPDGGIDKEGTRIFPKSLAMVCQASSNEYEEIPKCWVKLNKQIKSLSPESSLDGTKTFNSSIREHASLYIAEAIKAKRDAEDFSFKVIDPIKYATTSTTIDDYSIIIEMNKAIVTSMNGLLKVYSTKLSLDTHKNYKDYVFDNEVE